MDSLPLLFLLLILLFCLSAFFSGSETALMALDRYKLRHKAQTQHSAKLALELLKTPDKVIGLILLGNNLVNILITQLATYIGLQLGGSIGAALATGVLALMLLIFAELTPKTLAAVKSEQLAYPAAIIYTPLLKIAYPLVHLANIVSNTLLKWFGVDASQVDFPSVTRDELRTIVSESNDKIPDDHQDMLLRVLDLESITVEDIMIPRNEIVGIDLSDRWDKIESQLLRSQHTRMLVYQGSLDTVSGFIHLRKLLPSFKDGHVTREHLEQLIRPGYYTLETTPLSQQLLNFKRENRRLALVVDEYGEIEGMVTLEDILQEIVGQYSRAPNSINFEITQKPDGSTWVDGSVHMRELYRETDIYLPSQGAKTLNGLIIEHLEAIPVQGLCMLIDNYPIEIRKVSNNAVKTLIIYPKLERNQDG